jgi:RNA polymerase-binding protein DksA
MKKLNKNKVAKRKPVKKATPKKVAKKQTVKIKKTSKKVAKKKTVKKVTPKKVAKKQVAKIRKTSKKVAKKKIVKKITPKKVTKKQVVKIKKTSKKVAKKKIVKKVTPKKAVKKTTKKEILTQKDLNQIKKVLIEKKVSIMNKLNSRKLAETDTDIGDEADTASQNNEREMQFELDEISSMTIKAIDNALTKLNARTFGLCECCGCKISVKRLQAMPWCRYCIECQTEAEKNANK